MSRKLTKDLILSRLSSENLDTIKILNLWGNNIDDISLISEMPSLEIINLNTNQIKDLKYLKNLKNLKELYLKNNNISDFNQIEHLKNCKKLEILNLSENPISQQQNYRQKILNILPGLKKLDDIENTNNFQHSKFNFHQNPLMLFKKIFPKRINKINNNKINDLNASVNIDEVNNGRYTVNNKNDLLNTSFQKKKNLGTFKIVNKKSEGNKNINLNLDLSFDYSKKNLINEPNKSTNIDDYSNNNTEMDLLRNKYNKKVIGNYKQLSHTKNYPSTMLSYQEFDEPIKAEKKEEKEKEKNLNNKNEIYSNNDKNKIKEDIVIQSIKLLLDTLNISELKCVNEDIINMLKEKKV